MIASLPDLILVIIGYLAVLAAVATFYVRYSYGYWERRNTPYLEPTFPFGNGDSLIPKGFSLGIISKKFYDGLKSKGHRAGGKSDLNNLWYARVDLGRRCKQRVFNRAQYLLQD